MTRQKSAIAVLLLLLFSLFSGAAGAEEQVLATPTDLSCLHEQTKTTIYFFDSPIYIPMNAEYHRVSGPATVETVCLDCGEVLSSETVGAAEEVQPHYFRKGACALCGYKDKNAEAPAQPTKAPQEWVITAEEDGSTDGLFSVTLTTADLYDLEKANVPVALVRGKSGEAMVALDVTETLRQTEATGAALQVRLAEREDGSFYAGVFLVSDTGTVQPESEGITLRFYRQTKADVRISLAPSGEDRLVETECVWNEKGYWSVPYTDEGTYFVLQ